MKRKTDRNRSQRGMTLIDVMISITLIALVASVVGYSGWRVMVQGQIKTARTQALELSNAVKHFSTVHSRLPTNAEGLAVLVNPPRGQFFLERAPRDPWGGQYYYIVPGVRNPRSYDIFSYGPDQQEGGGDDVGNWPEQEEL